MQIISIFNMLILRFGHVKVTTGNFILDRRTVFFLRLQGDTLSKKCWDPVICAAI